MWNEEGVKCSDPEHWAVGETKKCEGRGWVQGGRRSWREQQDTSDGFGQVTVSQRPTAVCHICTWLVTLSCECVATYSQQSWSNCLYFLNLTSAPWVLS